MFKNRSEAGKLLAKLLFQYKNDSPVICAIPRGGVPVANEIARALNAPLNLVFMKKIGHPSNKEYAIGAAGIEDFYISPDENASPIYIKEEVSRVRERLNEMKEKFLKNTKQTDIKNKVVIIVDDGIATGKTIAATISVLRKSFPKKIIVATPVASKHSVNELSEIADQVITITTPDELFAIGSFYENFRQLTDEDVIDILHKRKAVKTAI
jgi:putative phosphoribosyl transferase